MRGDLSLMTYVSGVCHFTIDSDAIAQMSICEDLFAIGDGQGCTTTSAVVNLSAWLFIK